MAVHHRNANSLLRRITLVLTCALCLSILLPPRVTHAQDAFSCIEELTDDQVRYRISYIEEKLEKGKKHATRWRYTWMGLWLAIGGVTTYLAIDAANDDEDWNKFGWAYMAGGAYFVATTHMFLPAADVWGAKRIRRQDDSTEEARRAKLRYATETLQKASGVQELAGGPMGVVGSLVYGVVGGTIKATQWTGLSRGLTAGMYIAPPVMMGLQTATAPRQAAMAYESYRGIACSSKYYDRGREGPDLDFSMSPAGGSFRINF
ncbi:MAG: hypothetical protein AMJ62_14705 [Myxococcales bacterium SG8_38]|nr:MAG: hypothetical protein AMJ62_14705 [Myxococcales bacterium SG8_38]